MTHSDQKVVFRGGIWASAIPLAVFLAVTIGLVIAGAPKEEGMILGAMLGLSIGMLFVTNMAHYSERVFTLMANRTATVAVVCWLWAGAFAGILGESGLVEATVWIGWKLGLTERLFTVVVFILAALFAVSVGTGLGTIVGFTPVMYPAGIVLGGEPAALMGAIISGAAFGDNLAPISDTTIVSATTQETDVAGVVKSRLKYVLIAAGLCCVCFFIWGGGKTAEEGAVAQKLLEEHANPEGLPMLIPAVLVFFIAVRGYHFLAALTAGIVAAVILGPVVGVFSIADVFHITDDGLVEGSIVSGAMGLVPVAILTLLLVTAIGLMVEGGFLDSLMAWLDRTLGATRRGAEASVVALVSFANLCVSVNTVAMITVGPLVNGLRKRHGIQAYRSANLMDTISCSFPFLLPYSAIIPASVAIHRQLHENYAFVPVLSWSEMVPFIFYGIILFPVMICAVITGWGSKRG
jgi:Na+/H+ antiporter NhaC